MTKSKYLVLLSIGSYYRSNIDVVRDVELQSYVNEISAEGTGKYGGAGKVSLAIESILCLTLILQLSQTTRVLSSCSYRSATTLFAMIQVIVREGRREEGINVLCKHLELCHAFAILD